MSTEIDIYKDDSIKITAMWSGMAVRLWIEGSSTGGQTDTYISRILDLKDVDEMITSLNQVKRWVKIIEEEENEGHAQEDSISTSAGNG